MPNIYDNIDVHLLSTLQVGLSATRKHGPATLREVGTSVLNLTTSKLVHENYITKDRETR